MLVFKDAGKNDTSGSVASCTDHSDPRHIHIPTPPKPPDMKPEKEPVILKVSIWDSTSVGGRADAEPYNEPTEADSSL